MSRIIMLCIIMATVVSLSAQSIALKGKVTDQSQKPITGAVVTLKSKQLSDTTDAEGAFSIAGGTGVRLSSVPSLSGAEILQLAGGVIVLRLSQKIPVCVELFDVRGNLLQRTFDKTVPAGEYRIAVKQHLSAPKMLVVRVSVGEKAMQFRYLPFANGVQTGVSGSVTAPAAELAKLQASVDELEVAALGYTTKTVAISSYSETVNVTLEMEANVQCTQSRKANVNVSGSGPHEVVVETNSDPGIKEGTIYRPKDLGPGKNYPIFIWGEGACSLDGTGNSAAMAEIASHGYFVIADGTPGGSGGRPMDMAQLIKPTRAYITWAIAENRKPCSAYYQSLDTSKVAGNGFSCGGLMGMATAGDPRTTTWGVSSSGSFGNNPDLWNSVHTPVLIEEGHKDETGAYNNGLRDYNGIAPLGHPIMFFSNRNMGHGGDLWARNGGDFTKINLAWLNWWLKGDEGATGKGVLVGPGCSYCTDSNWEVKSANLP